MISFEAAMDLGVDAIEFDVWLTSDKIPETHAHGHERGATYSLLVGFCIMLVTDVLLG